MAWLRVSGENAETDLDYDAVTGGATAGDTGVESGALLIEFAEAVLDRDNSRLEVARRAIVAAIGEDGLVDAASVVGLFCGVDRVANATGTPLEDEKAEKTADLRAKIGIDAFAETKAALETDVA